MGCETCMRMRMRGVHAHADARHVCACGCKACMRMRMRGVHAYADAGRACTHACEARMHMRMRGTYAHADARHACMCGCEVCMHGRMQGVYVCADARRMRGACLATANFRMSAALYLNLPLFLGLLPRAPLRVNLWSGGGATPSDQVDGGAFSMILFASLRVKNLSFTMIIQKLQ